VAGATTNAVLLGSLNSGSTPAGMIVNATIMGNPTYAIENQMISSGNDPLPLLLPE